MHLPNTRTVLVLWGLAVALVIIGSLLPASAFSRVHFESFAPNDKVVHFMGYTVLALLPVAFLEFLGIAIALAASMIPMGIILEFVQRLVPGRSFEVGDMLANTLGVMTGILVALWLRTVLRRIFVPAQSRSDRA